MKRTVLLAFAGLLGAMVPAQSRAQAACPQAGIGRSIEQTWQDKSGQHPLVGAVLRGTSTLAAAIDGPCIRSPIEQLRRELTEHLEEGGIALLGEVHDNEAQHALRGELIKAIATELAKGKKHRLPALVFEHIRTDQAAALETRPAPTAAGARDLLERLDWKSSGWPAAEIFLPIFEVAVTHGLPILPGHPTRAEVRDVARRGPATLPADTVSRLGLDVPLSEALQNSLLDELEDSHCGLMPRTAFTNMAFAQRYRDAHLADVLVQAAKTYGSAILLAGNGHVRTDRGVPSHLLRMAPDRKVMSVMLLEVSAGVTDVAAYVPRDPSGKPAADFTILTPRTDRPDPCDAMRAQFKKRQ